MRLKNKLSGSVLLLVAFVVFAIGIMVIGSEKALLTSEMKTHQNDLIQHLAKVYEESLYQNELVFFNYTKGLTSERGFISAFFVDNSGRIQIHSDPTQIGKDSLTPEEKSLADIKDVYRQHYLINGRRVLDLAAPVWFGQSRVGVVRLLLDEGVIQQFISENLHEIIKRMAWISLLALLMGLLGAHVLARMIVAPIERVVYAMRQVAKGKLDPAPELDRKDELGWMTKELNHTIQKLKELDEMKREFIASVTHEFRSPLTAIESFISLLIKGTYGPLTSEQKESLLTIKNNTIRLTSFVDDLLTTAKLEAKKMDIFLSKFDLCDVAREMEKLFSSLAADHHLALQLIVPRDPITVNSDRVKVVQILSNLVSNALKFTQQGAVTIQVTKASDGVKLIVMDTGVGIPDSEKHRIFEKFYRVGSTAHTTKGTGLGLPIVKAYSDLLGLTIHVANNPVGGSQFIVKFPNS